MDKEYLVNNYIKKGDQAYDNGNMIKCLNYYLMAEEVLNGVKDLDLIINIALVLDEMGESENAEKKYKEALGINEFDSRAHYGLGVIYDERENFTQAIEHYKKAIEINPVYDRALFYLANDLDIIGEKEEAIIYYEKLLEI